MTVGCAYEVEDPANVPAAIIRLQQAMTPALPEQCEEWLVLLHAATAHRSESDVTGAVSYALYAAELRRWPADVAKSACERLARGKPGRGTNWFPTLAELVAECERLAGTRSAMLAALQAWKPPKLPHPNDRRFGEPTEAEKAEVHRMAQHACESLREAAEKMAPRGRHAKPFANTAGKPDAGGLTAEMREVLGRRG